MRRRRARPRLPRARAAPWPTPAGEPRAAAATAGARLALADAGGRAAGFDVELVPLDSSPPGAPQPADAAWDPGAVARNAERAASDPAAVAYIGELELGGSAVSVPITNDAGLLQVSPEDGLTSLTRRLPGAGGVGPERYYPSGERSFLRLVPIDFLRASTLVRWARELGARRLVALHDGSVSGRELASQVALSASCAGLSADVTDQVGDDPAAYPKLAQALAEERPDAVVYAAATPGPAAALAGLLAARLGGARVLVAGPTTSLQPPPTGGPDRVVRPADGRLLVVRASRPVPSYPRAGRRVLERLAETGDAVPADALYGYEAMSLVLDAIERAGPGVRDRTVVRDLALEPRVRARSVLGRYRIDAAGDVSETRFAGLRAGTRGLTLDSIRPPGFLLAPPSPKLTEPAGECGGLLRPQPSNQ